MGSMAGSPAGTGAREPTMVWMNCLVGLARTPSRKELRTCVPPATVPFRRVRSMSRASRSSCWCMSPECTRRSGSQSTVWCPRARCRITRAARLKSGFLSSHVPPPLLLELQDVLGLLERRKLFFAADGHFKKSYVFNKKSTQL